MTSQPSARLPDQTFLILFRADPPLAPGHLSVVMDVIKTMATDRMGLAFTTKDGTTFGVVAVMQRVAAKVKAALEGRMPVKDKDFVMVFTLDRDFAAIGNSSGWRHVQALLPKSS